MAREDVFAKPLAKLGLTNLPVPMWGIATVTCGRQFYQPDEGGTLAAIVPAFEQGHLVDLAACSFLSRQVRSRRGVAAVLGHEWIDNAKDGREPLRVFDDVFSWLRGRCRGVVVLDFKAAGLLLRDVPALHCESPAMVQVLTEVFEWPAPYPPVTLAKGVRQ